MSSDVIGTASPVDALVTGNGAKPDEMAILRRWRSEFQQDFNVHKVWLKEKKLWEEFYDGEQWNAVEKKILKERGQPEVVINLIKPRVDGIVGDYLGRRVMTRAKDRGSNDFETAKHITETLRYIEGQNKFDESEAQVGTDLLLSGAGWYKCSLEFDNLEPEIAISYRPNEDIVVDRRCRKRDLTDAKRLYETIWVESEDLIETYPDHKDAIEAAGLWEPQSFMMGLEKGQNSQGDDYAVSDNVSPNVDFNFETFLDKKRKRLRVINIWERVQKRAEFVYDPEINGLVQDITEFSASERSALRQAFPNAQYFFRHRWQLNAGVFIANKILERYEDVRTHDSMGKFPLVRAVAHMTHGDVPIPYGMVKQYVDPQREYNKRRSKLLHKSSVARVITEEGAVDDIERTREEVARPDGFIVVGPNKRFEIDKDDPNQVDVYMLELSHNEIEKAGVSREFIGQENKQLSGRAIGLRQIDGQKMLRPFFAALRAARRDIFGIALEEAQQYWTSEKLIKITDDPEAGMIVLNQKVRDPETGEIRVINDLRLGKYDIKIDEDAETPNQRSENFQMLSQLGQAAMAAGQPFPLEMLIKSSDLPNKKEWLEAIAQQRAMQMQMMQMQAAAAQAGAGQNGQTVTPTGMGG